MTSILSGGVLRTAPFCKVKIVDGADQDLLSLSWEFRREMHSKQAGSVKSVEKDIVFITGKSLSEALIFASTNPQYDDK